MLFLNRFQGFRTLFTKVFSTMSKESTSIMHTEKPLLSFGIIADVQYADIDDGHNFAKTKKRYYRNGLNMLKEAVTDWSKPSHNPEISFILNLGDLIDGWNKRHNISQLAFDRTLAEFDKFKGPVHHSWGNHDFYNFSRDQLLKTKLNSKLATEKSKIHAESEVIVNGSLDEESKTKETKSKEIDSDEQRIYYDFSPHQGFRVVMLDSYDISMLGYDAEHPNYKKAEKLLKEHNPNAELNSSIGLEGKEVRWVQYNGGVGDTQLHWLDGVLKKADENNEIVIVTNHSPIYTPATGPNSLCWTYDQVLEILHRHSCVVAFFSGHDHGGGFARDTHDISHVTLSGVIEAPPGYPPYFTAHIYEDKLELKGHGQLLDRTIPFSQTLEMDFGNRLKIEF